MRAMSSFMFACFAFATLSCGFGNPSAPPASTGKAWDETELGKAVQNKKPEEVIVIMGRPADSSDGEAALKNSERSHMTFKNAILDKYSGKLVDARIRFFYGEATGQGHVR